MRLNRTPDPLDRSARNDENENWSTIESLISKLEREIDNLILENSGDSNAEVIVARGEFTTLGRRLDGITSQLVEKATKKELTTQESRIDNLVAHAGDTDGNAELLDIRVGYDGTLYDTAGDAVRAVSAAMTPIDDNPITGIRRITSEPSEIAVNDHLLDGRSKLIIKNEDTTLRIRVGENKEDLQQQGYPIEPGASAEFEFRRGSNIPIYAVSEGTAVNVAVMEV